MNVNINRNDIKHVLYRKVSTKSYLSRVAQLATHETACSPSYGVPAHLVQDNLDEDLPVGWCVDCVRTAQSCECDFKPQSGTTDDANIMKISSNEMQQNVNFSSGDDPYMYSVKGSSDPTRALQDTTGDALGDFFQRPLKVFEFEWGTDTAANQVFDPWSLFLANPRVSNRMTNFNLMRARLHLRFMINGNSFHYGRALAVYHPQHTRDDFTELGTTASLVQGSQMPHIFLDPTTSTGGDLCLPFFTEESNVTLPFSTWSDLGRVHIISLNDLRHANGALDKSTISVFAWLEDVELNMLTSLDMPLSPQSGKEVDEANSKGTISGPATAVAKMAATLADAPVIGPFAMATAQAASTTAAVAKLFGYSRPSVTKDPEPYKPAAISSLATTTVPDGVQKLTVDDKQELTIDPTISGIGPGDPMNICQIAKRESYLTTFNWNIGVGPETLLWNGRVDPTLWRQDGDKIYLPACAMAALPFTYWTGTMKFRFQIVCSAFHKGRVKVVYDPNYIESNEYNTNYSEIIDIAEKQDFTVEIGCGQANPLMFSLIPGANNIVEAYNTAPLNFSLAGNGILGMSVVNELTTPDTTAPRDIQVNVFISAGDDFQVFVPTNRFQRYSFKPQNGFEAQSGKEEPGAEDTDVSPPQQTTSEVLGNGISDHEHLNKVFVGETIKSFRPLLKRYSQHSVLNGTFTEDRLSLYGRRSAFPFLRGRVASAVHLDSSQVPFNYCNTVLMHWVVMAFSGYRGAIRWKITPTNFLQSSNLPIYNVERSLSTAHYDNGRVTTFPYTTESNMAFQGAGNFVLDLPPVNQSLMGCQGMAIANGFVNPNVEFEVPYYSNKRFEAGKRENYTARFGDRLLNVFDYRIFTKSSSDATFSAFVATGEDFQVYFWSGLPPVYYEPTVPSPSVAAP